MREISERCIILRKVPYKESSFIIDVLTKKLGKISVIANSVRKPSNKLFGLIDYLVELDCILYKKENKYTLKSAEFVHFYLQNINYKKSKFFFAAAEIISQIIFNKEDSGKIYKLLTDYLLFQKKVADNNILIFWRFLLSLYEILGIKLFVKHCAICKKETENLFAYFPISHGFICFDCYKKIQKPSVIKTTKEIQFLLSHFYQIGNFLDSLNLSSNTVSLLNNIFLEHLRAHFDKPFHLKSLK